MIRVTVRDGCRDSVWTTMSAGGVLSSMVWGHKSLAWELATPVVRNWPLIGKSPSTLVMGNGPLSRAPVLAYLTW